MKNINQSKSVISCLARKLRDSDIYGHQINLTYKG